MEYLSDTDEFSHLQDRRVITLQRLLQIQATELKPALDQASQLIAEALHADKVDVFLYDPSGDALVALGMSDTPMAKREQTIGLDRLALANGGRTVGVFQTNRSYRSGHADQDPGQLPGFTQDLGVRSQITAPLEVAGERRGVLMAASEQPDFFSDGDLQFLEAVARWVGMVAQRAELVERMAQDAAERGRRMAAEELITVLAHDLRNRLTPLRGRIDLIRQRAGRDHREHDLRDANEAADALERLNRLVTDLLDVSRLERGLFSVNPRPVELGALAREIAGALSSPSSQIHVHAHGPICVQADPNRIRQAAENLLSNALKVSPEGTPVTIEIGVEPINDHPQAIITVSDQGPGIAPELMPRLFTRFATGPGSKGLGLGLYLASQVAAAHGGRLTVDSTPGKGARFRLELPGVVSDTECLGQQQN